MTRLCGATGGSECSSFGGLYARVDKEEIDNLVMGVVQELVNRSADGLPITRAMFLAAYEAEYGPIPNHMVRSQIFHSYFKQYGQSMFLSRVGEQPRKKRKRVRKKIRPRVSGSSDEVVQVSGRSSSTFVDLV